MTYAFDTGKTVVTLALMSKTRGYLKQMKRAIDLFLEENKDFPVLLPLSKEEFLGELLLRISDHIPIILNFNLKNSYMRNIIKEIQLPSFIEREKIDSSKSGTAIVMKIEERKVRLLLIIKRKNFILKTEITNEIDIIKNFNGKISDKSPLNMIISKAIEDMAPILIN